MKYKSIISMNGVIGYTIVTDCRDKSPLEPKFFEHAPDLSDAIGHFLFGPIIHISDLLNFRSYVPHDEVYFIKKIPEF